MNRIQNLLLVLMLLFVAAPSRAEELTADQIAQRILRSGAFDAEGAQTKLRMVLIDKGGKKRERAMEILSRKKDGRVQSVMRFGAPQDVAGTAFLILEQKGGTSEQYIYLPGLKRTRRIVGREREGSFMGSDFAYSDLRRADADQAKHKKLPDDKIGNDATYVLESTPKPSAKSSYSKIETWVRKSDFLPLRTRFYDAKGKLQKTLYARRVEKQDGKPLVRESRMESENGHATLLIIESIERRDALADSLFTPTALEHP